MFCVVEYRFLMNLFGNIKGKVCGNQFIEVLYDFGEGYNSFLVYSNDVNVIGWFFNEIKDSVVWNFWEIYVLVLVMVKVLVKLYLLKMM